MKLKQIIYMFLISGILFSCTNDGQKETKFNHLVEQFADIKVLRYKVPGFEELSLKEKELALKEKDIDNKLKIAQTNKNKYDSGSKKK